MSKDILLATTNPGKLKELESLAEGLGVNFATPDMVGINLDVDEIGSTFIENAKLKASAFALESGLFSIADDSGLIIDALDGRPGVLSARFGGTEITFDDRMALVLEEMLNAVQRTARFVCVIAMADPDGKIVGTAEGICEGSIAFSPSGTGGFGYDPIFIPTGHEKTFGELSPEIKNSLSHRKNAINKIIPFLQDFVANRLDLAHFET